MQKNFETKLLFKHVILLKVFETKAKKGFVSHKMCVSVSLSLSVCALFFFVCTYSECKLFVKLYMDLAKIKIRHTYRIHISKLAQLRIH